MRIVYFDSGTTNTRAYLLEGGAILSQAKKAVGSKDTALQGSNRALLQGMKELYDAVLVQGGLADSDIGGIYLSGMASSPSGIVEVPHLSLPVDRKILADSLYAFSEEAYFGRELRIVPGLKNIPRDMEVSPDRISAVNNVRGEELQAFGVLRRYGNRLPERCAIVLPGSHTQVVFVQSGVLVDLLATVTGELYQAVAGGTILGSGLEPGGQIDPEMVRMGYRNLKTLGINRALYVARTLELFGNGRYDRHSYLEGVLNGGVLDAMLHTSGGRMVCMAIEGERQYEIFDAICAEFYPDWQRLLLREEGIPFSVRGLLSLLEDA